MTTKRIAATEAGTVTYPTRGTVPAERITYVDGSTEIRYQSRGVNTGLRSSTASTRVARGATAASFTPTA